MSPLVHALPYTVRNSLPVLSPRIEGVGARWDTAILEQMKKSRTAAREREKNGVYPNAGRGGGVLAPDRHVK